MLDGLFERKLWVVGLAAFLVGSTVGAFGGDAELAPGSAPSHAAGCADLEPDWPAVDATRNEGPVQQDGEHARRMVRWTLDAADRNRGLIDACIRVGVVEIDAGSSDEIRVRALVEAEGPDAAEIARSVELDAVFARSQGSVGVAVGEVGDPPTAAQEDGNRYHVRLAIEVPGDRLWSTDASVGTGQLRIDDLRTQQIHGDVGTGEITIDQVETHGQVILSVGTGEIDVETTPIASGAYELDVGTGEIDVGVSRGSDVGFEVTGETGAGDVDIDIGPTEEERDDGEDRGPSDRGYARTQGYDSKAVQVPIQATASVGDIDVTAT